MKKLLMCAMVLLMFWVSGCGGKKGDYASFFVEPQGETPANTIVSQLVLDTLQIDAPGSSYVGFSGMHGDKIYFADQYLCRVFEYDKDLRLLSQHMRQGRGPQEIPLSQIEGYGLGSNGNHYFVGATRDIYIFDSTLTKVNNINFLAPRPENGVQQQNDSQGIGAGNSSSKTGDIYKQNHFYALDYENMIIRQSGDYLYFNVIGGDENNNIGNHDFYQNSRIIMKVNATDGTIAGTMGRMPPAVKFMSAFVRQQFDIDDDGNFLVSFEADSLVYVYNCNFEIQCAFGRAGTDMKTDYAELSMNETYRDGYEVERARKGCYTSIKRVGDYVFRSYKTGGDLLDVATHSPQHDKNENANLLRDKMQIYKLPDDKNKQAGSANNGKQAGYGDIMLIGDVDVPVGFTVLGYMAPYFYSAIIADEQDEALTVFRFKLSR